MEEHQNTRKRVNFSVSVKGIVTPDVTVEKYECSNEEIVKEAAELLQSAMVEADRQTKER